MDGIIEENYGVNRALLILMMTDEIEKSQKLQSKRFAEPLRLETCVSPWANDELDVTASSILRHYSRR